MVQALMKKALLLVSLAALAAAPSCGGGSPAPQTEKFVGAWTFQSGMLTPMCGALAAGVMPVSLVGLPVTLAQLDSTTLSLTLNASCVIHLQVSGATATVAAAQTCTLDVAGLGPTAVDITTWTLTLTGDHIDNTIAGNVAGFCSATGVGVLVRGTTDAGTAGGG
jgi:hypothetical protein